MVALCLNGDSEEGVTLFVWALGGFGGSPLPLEVLVMVRSHCQYYEESRRNQVEN